MLPLVLSICVFYTKSLKAFLNPDTFIFEMGTITLTHGVAGK